MAHTHDDPVHSALPPGARLADRVAEALLTQIGSQAMQPGQRLPTESELVLQFGVSRTVIREAVARLKSLGRLTSRQGSGVYVREPGIAPLSFDAHDAVSIEAVVQMAEVRRALDAEVAALAAARGSLSDLCRVRQAMAALGAAVARGGDGVAEDLAFHRSIALAARNPFLLSTLQYLSHFLTGAIRVTRAIEARREDFRSEVLREHQAIVDAIEAGDAMAARTAASSHMDNAIRRIGQAEPHFWLQEGEALARALMQQAPLSTTGYPNAPANARSEAAGG